MGTCECLYYFHDLSHIKIFFVLKILEKILWFFIFIKKSKLLFRCIFFLYYVAWLTFNLTYFIYLTNFIYLANFFYLTNLFDFLILWLRILLKRIILNLDFTLSIWFLSLRLIRGAYILFITLLWNLNFLLLGYRIINWLLLACCRRL